MAAQDGELVDYEEGPEVTDGKLEAEPQNKGSTYTGVHSVGFRDFLLKPELMHAITDCGFEHPSEVQHECIPQAILGGDILCQAKSGMGKTAVFVLTVLQQIQPSLEDRKVLALVLGHTRELAFQINREFQRFSVHLNPKPTTAVFFGGVNIERNVEVLRAGIPHIVVGTPGRILELSKRHLVLTHVQHFVLDECDRMLESLDMRADVQAIFQKTARDKQVMMFSATLSKAVRPVCLKFMQDPLEILVDDTKLKLHGLQQHYVRLQENQKNRKLIDLLDSLEFNQVVIFVRSVNRCIELNKLLVECNFPSICIHSGMQQPERIKQYELFKDFKQRILVATDLIGRGIDIERVNIVINYDMPENADSYLHRVGRAGRFGSKGLAITFVSSPADSETLNAVQARFVVSIPELPASIDVSSYMTA